MDLHLQLKGVDALMKQSVTFQKKLPTNVLNSIRRQVRRTITTVKRDIRQSSGIGRRIWQKNASTLNKLVTLVRARVRDNAIETGISLKGLPGLIEQGGQIKRHEIKGKPWLIFTGKQGLVFAKKVQHPGAAVRRHSYADQAVKRDESAVQLEVRTGITTLIGETFGQSK